MNATSKANTPLAKALAGKKSPAVTPLEAFKLARARWLAGKPLRIGELARDLGVSRGKIYHWVGSKDLLLDEIIWSLAKPAFEQVVKDTPGSGIDHVIEVFRRFMATVLSFGPLQRFVDQDPLYALRILSRDARSAQHRLIQVVGAYLARQEALGYISLPAHAEKIAEMLIRANGALIYHDVISGRAPCIEQACAISRLLLSARRIPDHPASSLPIRGAADRELPP